MAERDADDADRTAVEPFSALTAAININFGTVFAIGAAYLIVITQLLDQPPQFAVEPLYAPTQIMYPPCDNDSCKTTNLVIPAALRLFQGCTICVDTLLHYLCRVCSESPLFKGILYSRNGLFCRIKLF